MILNECGHCGNWQSRSHKDCNRCKKNIGNKPVLVTKVGRFVAGKYAYATKRHPGMTLNDAKGYELKVKQAIEAPPDILKLSQLFEIYCGYLDAKTPTWAVDARRMSAEMVTYFGDISAVSLKRLKVLEFRNVLSKRVHRRNPMKHLSNRTINAYGQVGRGAFNYLAPGGHNPFRAIGRLPENIMVEYLEEDEEQKLLHVAKAKYPMIFEFLCVSLATGFRKSNVLNLRRSEVDFINGTISIIQKGNRPFTTPLADMAREVLKNILSNGTDYFWLNPLTHRPFTDIRKGFEECKRQAGITKPFRIHGLRHTVAYKLLRAKGNLVLVQDVLGHADIQSARRYTTMTIQDVRQGMECLNISTAM